jgi:hypothetical protein
MPSQPNLNPAVLDEKLKRLLQFTDSDLVANRTGQFSEFQKTRMRYEKQSASQVIWAVFFILFVVGGIVLVSFIGAPYRGTRNQSAGSGNSVHLCVLPLVFIAPLFFQLLKTSEDLDTQKVLSIKGPIKRHQYRYRYGRATHFRIISGDKRFEVSKFIYDAFEDGQIYSLYYTPTMRLIAVERIPEHIPS